MSNPSIYVSPEINGVDTGAAGWYKIDKYGGNLALRVASSNICLTGEIRFNADLGVFQGFDGNCWVNFRDNLVLNEQLKIGDQIAAINTSVKEYKTKVRQVENLMIDAGVARDKLHKVASEYRTKLHDNNPSIKKNYAIAGDLSVGQAVVFVGGSSANVAVSGFSYSGKSLNAFGEMCNIAGIVETVLPDGTCDVIVKGPVNARLALQSTSTEFQKSSDLKNGVLAILDSTGRVYQTARKPLSDFIQIGFLLENSTYSTSDKMVKIWVEPMIHIL
jgi:hypothetical protein